jgi:hypothetical protein
VRVAGTARCAYFFALGAQGGSLASLRLAWPLAARSGSTQQAPTDSLSRHLRRSERAQRQAQAKQGSVRSEPPGEPEAKPAQSLLHARRLFNPQVWMPQRCERVRRQVRAKREPDRAASRQGEPERCQRSPLCPPKEGRQARRQGQSNKHSARRFARRRRAPRPDAKGKEESRTRDRDSRMIVVPDPSSRRALNRVVQRSPGRPPHGAPYAAGERRGRSPVGVRYSDLCCGIPASSARTSASR